MQLDECDIYRYISLFFNNVIYIDKAIFIDIYPLKKFPDVDISKIVSSNKGILPYLNLDSRKKH